MSDRDLDEMNARTKESVGKFYAGLSWFRKFRLGVIRIPHLVLMPDEIKENQSEINETEAKLVRLKQRRAELTGEINQPDEA